MSGAAKPKKEKKRVGWILSLKHLGGTVGPIHQLHKRPISSPAWYLGSCAAITALRPRHDRPLKASRAYWRAANATYPSTQVWLLRCTLLVFTRLTDARHSD